MLRIALLGDIHGELARLDSTLRLLPQSSVDLTLCAGDVGIDPAWDEPARHRDRQAHDESVASVLGFLRDTLGAPVIFVPGNHDLREPASDLPATNADGRVVEASGLRIAGFGGAGPATFGFAYEWDEAGASAGLARFAPDDDTVDVFLCHTPPAETSLDRVFRGDHVGSRSVGDALSRMAPRLFVCGHIHEAWGLTWIDGTAAINAGALAPPAEQEIAWIVEWDDGPARIDSFTRELGGAVERRTWHPES